MRWQKERQSRKCSPKSRYHPEPDLRVTRNRPVRNSSTLKASLIVFCTCLAFCLVNRKVNRSAGPVGLYDNSPKIAMGEQGKPEGVC